MYFFSSGQSRDCTTKIRVKKRFFFPRNNFLEESVRDRLGNK